ncbi:hypothetical protein [Terriglobus roseus]|uniref:hypothetical protein n=1 Tax=Terriglobus roseus TaxID=392734 RepID=UPI001FE0212D|nr:hypothetical protein [Terriglobus roseus]
MQAAKYTLLPGLDPVFYNLGLSLVILPVIGSTFFLLARRDGMSWKASAVLAAAPTLSGNFLWLGLIGMEHLFFVAFSLLAILFWFDGGKPSLRQVIIAGFFSGLVVLTRPEAVVFAPMLLAVTAVSRSRPRPWRDYAIVTALWFVATSLVVSANFWTSGSPMPATLQGRSWLYFHSTGGSHSVGTILRFVGGWVQRLPREFSTGFVNQLSSPTQLGTRTGLIGVVLLAFMICGVVALLRRKPLRIKFLLLWALVHFLTYLATFPAAGHGGRYQPIVVMLLFPLLFFGVLFALRRMVHLPAKVAFALVFFVMLVSGVASISTWRRVTESGVAHISRVHGEIGTWMQQNLPPDTRLAAFDIGRVSYEWKGQVIDLGGLVDPSYYHYLVSGQVPQYLRDKRIQYVMLPGAGTKDMGFSDRDGLEVVFRRCSESADWLLGWRYTINATQCQEIDRVPDATEVGGAKR